MHIASLLGAKMFLIRLTWEANGTQFFSTRFNQSRLNHFYLSWARNSTRLGSEHGTVELQVVVWLYTQGSFRFSARDTRSRLNLTRGSARFARSPDQLEARLGSLFGVQLTSARGSGSAWSSVRRSENRLNAWLGSAELGDRLGTQFGAQLGPGDS